MAAPKFYEGQEFHNPSDPAAPVLVYRQGKFLPKDGAGAMAPKLSPQDSGYLNDLHDKASKSLQAASMAQRYVALNKDVPTGGMAGWPIIGGAVRDMRAAKDPKFAQLEGITSSVAPSMRPPGSGSSSDTDIAMFVKGFVNSRVPYEANLAGANRLNDQNKFDAAHAAFMDSYYQHKGTLLGGEQAFSQYWAKKVGGGGDGMQVQIPGGGMATVRPR